MRPTTINTRPIPTAPPPSAPPINSRSVLSDPGIRYSAGRPSMSTRVTAERAYLRRSSVAKQVTPRARDALAAAMPKFMACE